jgi:hypothetical protein
MRESRGVYRALVRKLEGKGPLGRPRRTWEYNIKMDLQEVECGSMDLIALAQDRYKKTKLKLHSDALSSEVPLCSLCKTE